MDNITLTELTSFSYGCILSPRVVESCIVRQAGRENTSISGQQL